jgi:VanZ family protein
LRAVSAEVRVISADRGGIARLDDRLRLWTFVGWCLAWLIVGWAMLHPAPPPIDAVSDKTIHFLSFCAVSFAAVAFCRSGRQLAMAGAFCAVAAVGFETAQYFIPARAFEWGDILANVGGTTTGILLAALVLGGLQRFGWPSGRGQRRPARSTA